MTTEAASLAAALRAHLDLQPGESLYGVVDAARDKELAFEARDRFQQPIRMLFQGEAAQYMTDFAPYFMPIDPRSEYLESWAACWGASAGILLTSSAEPKRVFRHLREIFVVKDDGGQEYFFRFYDPRVLRTYAPTCTAEELRQVFGPIRAFLLEGSERGSVLQFAIGAEGLSQRTGALTSEEA